MYNKSKQPCALPLFSLGGGGGGGGMAGQGTLCARDNAVCRPLTSTHTRIIQKEPQLLIKYFISS